MARLTSRLERLERERRLPFVLFTGQVLERRAARASAIAGGSEADIIAAIEAAGMATGQDDPEAADGLGALTNRELLLTCLVAWGWTIEDNPLVDGILDEETRSALNAHLAIPGADADVRALDPATLEDLAGRHGPERQGRAAQRLGYV